MYNPYLNSVKILNHCTPGSAKYYVESAKISAILEDSNSPVTRKYQDVLYRSIMEKSHVDFGDIPKSRGDLKRYTGYNSMIETLGAISKLANEAHATNVLNYISIINEAIENIINLTANYKKGFSSKAEFVMLEYNTYVYLCVEATTALIYSFVDVMKVPDKSLLDVKVVNTDMRADKFYFDQLSKFNTVIRKMGSSYKGYLDSLCSKNKENFIGTTTAIGIGTVVAVALSIVPITRSVIYQIYHLRGKLKNYIDLQTQFLELNKSCVESNPTMTADKKAAVLKKQQKLVDKMQKLSRTLTVKSATSIKSANNDLSKDNADLSVDNLRDTVSDSPFEII